MSFSSRLKGIFFGCAIGLAVLVRLIFAELIGWFGRMAGVADYANELSILIGILAAWRLTARLNRYYTQRTAFRVVEKGLAEWASQVHAQKLTSTSEQSLKKTA
jgi:hypothetical protein